MKIYSLISLTTLLTMGSVCARADGLVLPSGELREELAGYLTAQAEKHWTARSAKVAALSSPAEVRERQQYIRRWMLDAMAFPVKTPLNAKITGGFARDGYRVEHLIFESQPKFYVTANVYIPTNVKGSLSCRTRCGRAQRNRQGD